MNNQNRELLIKDLNRFRKTNFPITNFQRIHIWLIIFRYFFTSRGFRSIFFYRILNEQYKHKGISKIIWIISLILTEIEIPYSAEIGGGLLIPHPKCIFINNKSVIGENVVIWQGVTIGGNFHKIENGRTSPIIGNNVIISAGAKVLGPVTIGDNSVIGANAVVIKDIPQESVAVGVPAKVVKRVEPIYRKKRKI